MKVPAHLVTMSESPMAQVSSPLTIGILRRGYSPSGGVEVYLKGLAQGLLEQGHRPILLGTDAWPESEWPGGEILYCASRNLKSYRESIAGYQVTRNFDLLISWEKISGCDIYRTDEGVHAAWLEARKPIQSAPALWFQSISPKHREKLKLERSLYSDKGLKRVITVSDRIMNEITRFHGYPREKMSLIRYGARIHGVSLDTERREARNELGIRPDEHCILFVGTGWERKGLKFAVRAVEKLCDPKVRLIVVGKGNRARYASRSVTFLGTVNYEYLKTIYRAGDLLVAPSLYEPFSLAGLEALGAGLPVVASAALGLTEVMTSGIHGEVLDDPMDIGALSEALRKWIAKMGNPLEAQSVRKGCVQLVSRFTLEQNLRETLDVIREVIAEKKG
jgi:UDP-glucose:(heptosyl)LPS alpha-1,3-glucosyltransferase